MTATGNLARLFAAERAVRPPPFTAEQGLQRLLADLGAQAAPVAVAAAALKPGFSAITKWILAGFVVGIAGSGAAAKLWSPVSTEPVVRPVAAPPKSNLAAAPEGALPTPPEPLPPSEAHAEQPAPSRSNKVAQAVALPEPSARQATFDAELRLINLAKRELDAGRPHLAKVWLVEHATSFPRGVFAADREALRVLAGCAEHPDPALARQFATQNPHSPMLQRLGRACDSPADAKSINETSPLVEPMGR